MTVVGDERMGGNQGMEYAVIEAQISALKDELKTRFESMEALLTQRIRHGDENMEVVVRMLMDSVKEIQAAQHTHDEWAKAQTEKIETRFATMGKENEVRFRNIEDKQLSWASSARTVGGLIGLASGAGGVAGTIIGITFGGG